MTANSIDFSRNGNMIETSQSLIKAALNQNRKVVKPKPRVTTSTKFVTIKAEPLDKLHINESTTQSIRVSK